MYRQRQICNSFAIFVAKVLPFLLIAAQSHAGHSRNHVSDPQPTDTRRLILTAIAHANGNQSIVALALPVEGKVRMHALEETVPHCIPPSTAR